MPSDFIKVIPVGMAPHPGICRYCGSNQRELVDFSITFDYEGAVMICVSCFMGEIIRVEELDLVPRRYLDQLDREKVELLAENDRLATWIMGVRDGVVAVLDSYDASVAGNTSSASTVSETDKQPESSLF